MHAMKSKSSSAVASDAEDGAANSEQAQNIREWGGHSDSDQRNNGADYGKAVVSSVVTSFASSTVVSPAVSRTTTHATGKFHKLSRKGTMKHTATKTVTNFHQATVAFVLDRHNLSGRSKSVKDQQRTIFVA